MKTTSFITKVFLTLVLSIFLCVSFGFDLKKVEDTPKNSRKITSVELINDHDFKEFHKIILYDLKSNEIIKTNEKLTLIECHLEQLKSKYDFSVFSEAELNNLIVESFQELNELYSQSQELGSVSAIPCWACLGVYTGCLLLGFDDTVCRARYFECLAYCDPGEID